MKRSSLKRGTSTLRRTGFKSSTGVSARCRPGLLCAKKTVDGDSAREVKRECDQIVRDILKLRDHCCMTLTCTETRGLQVSHFVKRGVLALRWNLVNCNLQCVGDNARHNTEPEPYRYSMVLFYGAKRVAELERIGKENPRVEYPQLLKIRDGLRAELMRLKIQ